MTRGLLLKAPLSYLDYVFQHRAPAGNEMINIGSLKLNNQLLCFPLGAYEGQPQDSLTRTVDELYQQLNSPFDNTWDGSALLTDECAVQQNPGVSSNISSPRYLHIRLPIYTSWYIATTWLHGNLYSCWACTPGYNMQQIQGNTDASNLEWSFCCRIC